MNQNPLPKYLTEAPRRSKKQIPPGARELPSITGLGIFAPAVKGMAKHGLRDIDDVIAFTDALHAPQDQERITPLDQPQNQP